MRDQILQSYERYLKFFSEEEGRFSVFDQQIKSEEDLISRKNMHGHVTVSGLIFSFEGELLLVFHKARGVFQQPGGHIDDTDLTLAKASAREITEETGLTKIYLHPWHKEFGCPINIRTQKISSRPEKGEGDHFHHDFMYVFTTNQKNVVLQEDEVSNFKWVEPFSNEIASTFTIGESLEKIKKLELLDF